MTKDPVCWMQIRGAAGRWTERLSGPDLLFLFGSL